MRNLEDNTLLLLTVAVSLAFAWILWPFYEAILWATVLAIVFAPLYRRLSSSMGQRHSLAALATILIIVTMVILPLTFIAASLVQEATSLYQRIQSDALLTWATDLLNRFGLTNLSAIHERLSAALAQGSKYLAAQALSIGRGTANFIITLLLMLYLLFFFLRDGGELSRRIKNAIPLREEQTPRSLQQIHHRHPCHVSGATSSSPLCKEHWVV
jgi:predicted PurR-regulated permease PerM